ncbi:MAG: leucine-rich repeat protein, partial [Bacteroidales bacterium]|nr:leucine-rich repeat protein [Bacteroidales bacterium]
FELKNIVIPETLDGQTVISIADKSSSSAGVFYNKGIISVTLPSTLENIGDYAFYYNNIGEVNLSDCITLISIGKYAFGNNCLTILHLSGCVTLEAIDSYSFYDNELVSVSFPASLISIGSHAYSFNYIGEINLGCCTALTSIGNDAFFSNSLSTLDLSACTSLIEIGSYAFKGNYFESFTLPDPIFDNKILKYWEDNDGETYNAGTSVTDLTNSYTANMMQFSQNNFYAVRLAVPQAVSINMNFNCPDRGMNITSLTLSNDKFNMNQAFPLFIIAGDTSFTIALNISSPETNLYMTGYEMTYSSDGKTKTYTDSLYVAIIINDNSELSYIGNQAIDAYNASLDSNELALQNNKAVIFRLFGEYDKAEDILNSALSIALDNFYGFTGIKMNMGVVKSDKKNVTEAMENYNDALTDLSGETEFSAIAPRIYYNTAWEYYNLKDYNNSRTKALATINHQKSNDYLIAKAYVLLGVNDAATGDTMTAIKHFEDAIDINPGSCIADIASEDILLLLNTDSYEFVTICGGDNYHGWEESGRYILTLESAGGADSIVTTFLTVNPTYHITLDTTICEGENHNGWTASGEYTQNLISVSGCDSIVTTHLTVNPAYHITLDTTICEGENHNGWTTSGIYVQNLITQGGCDSIITVNLNVEDCTTGLGHEKNRMFNFYPNPSRGTITLKFKDDTGDKIKINIINFLGEPVYEEEINGNIPEHILQLGTVPAGIYLISVRTGQRIYYEQIVVQ